MAIRGHYEHDIADLQRRLLALGEMVDRAIVNAVWALMHRDIGGARRVIANDTAIDEQRYEIEEQALRLIARQQPLAGDLRAISSWMGLASELERIGDYSEGIAKITIRGANEPLLKPLIDVPRMAELAQRMLRESVDAFVNRDIVAARKLVAEEAEVDELTTQVQNELLSYMLRDPRNIERALHLIFVAHNLERVADRTTNIAERLIFLVTGEIVALND